MKKVVGILLLCLILMCSTLSFATSTDVNDSDMPVKEETIFEDSITLEADDSTLLTGLEDTVDLSSLESLEGEIIYDDFYKMDNKDVEVSEIIDGNAYIMAESVKFNSAIIYGNVFVMAKSIEFENVKISGSAFILGEDIKFQGEASDIYACGKSVEILKDSDIFRDVRVASQNLLFDATAERNLSADVGEFKIGDNAYIKGKVDYSSEEEGIVSENAQIIGDINFTKSEVSEESEESISNKLRINFFDFAKALFKTVIIALIFVFLVKRFETLKRNDNDIVGDFAKNAGIGALCLIFVPVVSVLFMITIFGLGFGFILLALYFISLYIAIPVSSVEIAKRIAIKKSIDKKSTLILISLLIAFIVYILRLVPYIGAIIRFILLIVGLGILFSMTFQKSKKEEIQKVDEN